MAFLIGGANSLSAAYDIENSLRSDGSTTELTRTPGSETNRETFTFSCWHKSISSTSFFSCESDSNTKCVLFNHGSSQGMRTWNTVSGSTTTDIRDDAYYRDPSAWYHSVWAIDTTQGTEANRVKMYVNGQAITVRSGYDNYPSEDEEMGINQAAVHTVGARTFSGETDYLDGYLAEVHFVDGQQLTPSSFGETDEDSGIWKPKEYTGSYGTNGFFLEFKETGTSQNSSGMGADTSGNDNHYAVTNFTAVDQCTDTPTNSFCTLNPLDNGANFTLSEGNCQILTTTSGSSLTTATMAPSNGKWYWENKVTVLVTNSDYVGIGHVRKDLMGAASDPQAANASHLQAAGRLWTDYGTTESADYSNNWAANDIIMVAMDCDNGKTWYGINGTWIGANPATGGSNGASFSSYLGEPHSPMVGQNSGANRSTTILTNFGNPPFTISSGNADANGYGNFEYAVPSGYYALCSKNLAEFG
jgi:hypothetical protein